MYQIDKPNSHKYQVGDVVKYCIKVDFDNKEYINTSKIMRKTYRGDIILENGIRFIYGNITRYHGLGGYTCWIIN